MEMAAAGGANKQVFGLLHGSEKAAADANEVAAKAKAEATRLLQCQQSILAQEARTKDARRTIRLERDSNEEDAKTQDKKLAGEIESINAKRRSINEAMVTADSGYKDAIAKENEKLQALTKQKTEVTAQLQEAEKTAAAAEAAEAAEAAAAKAIAAQKQVLQAKLNLAMERERTATKEKEAVKAALAALPNAHGGEALRAPATAEVWELQDDDWHRDGTNLSKGVDVKVHGIDAPEGLHNDQAFVLERNEEAEERRKKRNERQNHGEESKTALVARKASSSDENQEEYRKESEESEEEEEEEEDQGWVRGRRIASRCEKRYSRVGENEGENKDEDEEEEDEDEWVGSDRRMKRSGDGKRRKTSADDGGASASATSTWKYPSLTTDNTLLASDDCCIVYVKRRPATSLPRGSSDRHGQEQRHEEPLDGQGGGGGGGRASSHEQDASDQGSGSDSASTFRKRGSRGGEATRQLRGIPRVNYAEDNEDGGGVVEGAPRGRRAKATARARGGWRNTPLSLSGELRLEATGEEALPDDVRAFRRLVRSVVKGLCQEDFALRFREAVDLNRYPGYVEVVAEAIDLAKIMFKLRQGGYDSRKGRDDLVRDINLIPENCKVFNGRGVLISQNAHRVAHTFIERLPENWSHHGSGGAVGGGHSRGGRAWRVGASSAT